jgi:carboxymethylenebutenolidase
MEARMKTNPTSLKRKAFREQLKSADIIVAPGAYDAFSARIIEKAGFKTIYIGGSNIHAVMGHADGESTLTEYMAHVKWITESVNIPVLADIDTGFGTGSPLDIMRAVREVERIGVAACHTEDQVTTNRVFAYNDPECVSRKEMLKKIEAALEAREDDEMAFIARTDARMKYGLEEALERGRLFAKAGCDMVCVQALQSVDELKRAIDYVGAPLMIFNGAMQPGDIGNTLTHMNAYELQKLGMKLVTFGNGVTRRVGKAIEELMAEIKRTGTENAFADRMITKVELQTYSGGRARDAMRKRYATEAEGEKFASYVYLTAADGHKFRAWKSVPAGKPRGAVVVIQEIFGVNNHIRSVTDRFAAMGYVAIAPAIFDRQEPGFECGYTPDDMPKARALMGGLDMDKVLLDVDAARKEVASAGKTAIVGYCYGGSVAWLGGCRLDFAAAVGYYGGLISKYNNESPKCPTILHVGSLDKPIADTVEQVKAAHPDVPYYVYDGANHGFSCDERGSFNPAAHDLALIRTSEFLARTIG